MNGISRRAFLVASTALAATAILTKGAFAQEVKESAYLKPQVDSGALPPVAERLPENPLVITPFERVGQQGGDWNHALVGGGSASMLVRYQGYDPLVRFTPDWSASKPTSPKATRSV